jgi:hypothetical protein
MYKYYLYTHIIDVKLPGSRSRWVAWLAYGPWHSGPCKVQTFKCTFKHSNARSETNIQMPVQTFKCQFIRNASSNVRKFEKRLGQLKGQSSTISNTHWMNRKYIIGRLRTVSWGRIAGSCHACLPSWWDCLRCWPLWIRSSPAFARQGSSATGKREEEGRLFI